MLQVFGTQHNNNSSDVCIINYNKYSGDETNSRSSSLLDASTDPSTTQLIKVATEFNKQLKETKEEAYCINEWRQIGRVLDRCFVILFSMIGIGMTIGVFIQPFLIDDNYYKQRII